MMSKAKRDGMQPEQKRYGEQRNKHEKAALENFKRKDKGNKGNQRFLDED